ncbi:unnamed protein product [Protopolystoma xenopodis]|uniref:Uncharacterized protein n=1 Tax=Protopolystoma xenopodis TaxID=117903 RepID=A0A448XFG6_9PLAT|nr:unnamed protein product [Protopolystoma xenopodis]
MLAVIDDAEYDVGETFENVPSPPISDAGNDDNYYDRRLRTMCVLLSRPDNKTKVTRSDDIPPMTNECSTRTHWVARRYRNTSKAILLLLLLLFILFLPVRPIHEFLACATSSEVKGSQHLPIKKVLKSPLLCTKCDQLVSALTSSKRIVFSIKAEIK